MNTEAPQYSTTLTQVNKFRTKYIWYHLFVSTDKLKMMLQHQLLKNHIATMRVKNQDKN